MRVKTLIYSFKLVKDHYSFLAPFYNSLTKLVFGDQLMRAKTCFAERLKEKKVLIIGGGNGLDYQGFQGQLSGEYWEISNAMLSQARINLANSSLTFYLDFFEATEGKLFNEVWLHFVLDTMDENEIVDLLGKIRKSITLKGRIYLVDFYAPKNTRQYFLNWSMISFFRIFAKHKRANIPKYESILTCQKWNKDSQQEFMGGWVKAQLWHTV